MNSNDIRVEISKLLDKNNDINDILQKIGKDNLFYDPLVRKKYDIYNRINNLKILLHKH